MDVLHSPDTDEPRGAVAHQPRVAFLFTGQGSQHVDMGRPLYEAQPPFRLAAERCEELLRPHLDRPLLSVLYPDASHREEASALLDEMAYAQPAQFVVQYALTELWRTWGVEPAVVVGHSVGEYAAACAAGVFSLGDVLKLVATRGRLLQSLPSGVMVAVFAPEDRVARALAPYDRSASIAAVNGPECVVISGQTGTVRRIVTDLGLTDEQWRSLNMPVACHSPLVEPILDAFGWAAKEVAYYPSRIPMVSTVTGQPSSIVDVANAGYWRRHLRAPVRFAAAIQALDRQSCDAYVEIGPSTTLLDMGRRCLKSERGVWVPSLRQGYDDLEQFVDSLRCLSTLGAPVKWQRTGCVIPSATVSPPRPDFHNERPMTTPMGPPELAGPDATLSPSTPADLRQQLDEAVPSERSAILTDYARCTVAQLLHLNTLQCVDSEDHLRDLGIDSLMAIELRDRLQVGLALRRSLPATLVFDYPTCLSIAGFLERELRASKRAPLGPTTAVEPGRSAPAATALRAEQLGDLSDAEVATLLLEKLGRR